MKYSLLAIAAAILMACSSHDEHQTETKSASHDGHPSTSASVSMPALPEVPPGARIFFANLKDGQTVASPLAIEMGVEGMTVDTANGIIKQASGHHHILVDLDSIPAGTVVPPTDSLHHYHFGKAQTAGEINLAPGKHTIALQFADGLHRSYGSRLNTRITVDVKQ